MSLLKTNEIQNYNGSSLTLTASTVSTSAQLNTGGNISVTGSLNVSDDSTTRTNLGLGTIATQDSDSITVTGGTATLGALTVSGSDSGDLVRITQTGSGNALVVEDETNPDSSPFVVDASGNVIIGQTSTNYKFRLNGTSHFGDGYDGTSYGEVQITRPGSQPDNRFHLSFVRQGNQVCGMGFLSSSNTFAIQNNGNNTANGVELTSGATSWGATSDERKKDIKSNLENALKKLLSWRTVYFNYKNDEQDTPQRIGLIAQDVQATLPEAVSVKEDEIGTLQLRYSETIPVLVKAIQEQQTIIESQQSQIDALTARIEALETT